MLSPILIGLWCFFNLALAILQWPRFLKLQKLLSPEREAGQQPALSVLVAFRDEEKHLKALIKALQSQEYPDFEIIMINDGSSDRSAELVRQKQKEFTGLRLIDLPPSGKKKALSVGISRASHECLVFTDADCLPATNQWLTEIGKAFASADLILGYAPLKSQGNSAGQMARFETLQTAFQYLYAANRQKPYMAVGRNLAYRRTLYKKVNGYEKHQHLPYGDDDLLIQSARALPDLKVKALLSQASFVYSAAPQSWAAWWRQKRRHYGTAYRYRIVDQVRLGFEGALQILYLPIFTLVLFFNWPLALGLLALRYTLQLWLSYRLSRHMQSSRIYRWFIIYEGLLVALGIGIHLQNLIFGKRKRW